MDARALKAKMILKDVSTEELCKATGMVPSTFYRKINCASEFTQGEISIIAHVLELSRDEVFAIFFADVVS